MPKIDLVSLVLGIAGFITIWSPIPPLGMVLGVAAIYTGLRARRSLKASQDGGQGSKMAVAGLILGVVDLLLPLLLVTAFAFTCGKNGFCM
jgi:hypothetical protein